MRSTAIAEKDTGFEPNGFTRLSYHYDAQMFGNIWEEWVRDGFSLAFVRDRGHDLIIWVPKDGEPIPLESIFEYLSLHLSDDFADQARVAFANRIDIEMLAKRNVLEPNFDKFLKNRFEERMKAYNQKQG